MPIKPVLLSVRLESRLWPSNRKSSPKQLIEFSGTASLFARTLERDTALSNAATPLFISSRQQVFLCRKTVRQLGLEAHYVFEETVHNTNPDLADIAS